jgi:hypothetical protein
MLQIGFFNDILDIQEIVLNRPSFNESALIVGDKFAKLWSKPDGKKFAKNLRNAMHEANRPKLICSIGTTFLGLQNNVG